MADKEETSGSSSTGDLIANFLKELVTSPLNLALLGVCGFLLYKILSGKKQDTGPPPEVPLPKMKKRDFTLEQLREFDGKGKDGRLLMAVNGKVFDVTRGKRFYGPGKRCTNCDKHSNQHDKRGCDVAFTLSVCLQLEMCRFQ